MASIPDFIEFLLVKRPKPYECPYCGNAGFVTNIIMENVPAELRIHATLFETQTPQFHGFYTISCTNCGHSTFFHRRKFDEWLAAKNPVTNFTP